MDLELDSANQKPAGEKANAPGLRSSPEGTYALPEDALAILPVRGMVLFPGMIMPIALGREGSIAAAQLAAKAKRPIGVLLQRNPGVEQPGPDDLCLVGTVASILRYITTPDGTHHAICQGQQRFRVVEYLEGYPFLVARVGRIEEPEAAGNEIEARFVQLKERALEVLELLPQAPQELVAGIQGMSSAGALADLVAGVMDIEVSEKQALLETVDLQKRMDAVLDKLAHRLQVLKLSREIDQRTRASMDETPRRGDRGAQESDRRSGNARRGGEAGAQGAEAPGAHVRRHGRVLHVAHLSRLAARAPVEEPRARCDRHGRGAAHSRRGSFRPRAGEEAHPRVPRGAQAQSRRPRADPVLRRPARSREDFARPERREGTRAEVRAGVARRRARRGRDTRAPAHLHWLAARQHHPGD